MIQQRTISISIIIPVYRVSPYIERCLNSVVRQSYNHFECILIDDASPDDSIAKCESVIAACDGPIRFRILHHEHNRGLSAARNTGIDAATGDYLLFVDSDDVISNDCVEKLMTPLLTDDSIEMVVGEQLRFSDAGPFNHEIKLWRCQEDVKTHEAVRDLYFDRKRQLPPAAWNKLTSKAFINSHHLRFKEGLIWEDALWTFFEMKYLNHVFVIPDVTYFYYYREDSISYGTDAEKKAKDWCAVCDIISANFTTNDERREAFRYYDMFVLNYIKLPKEKDLRTIDRRFSKALPFKKYPAERTLLWAAKILPHNNTGQEIFKSLSKALLGKQSR